MSDKAFRKSLHFFRSREIEFGLWSQFGESLVWRDYFQKIKLRLGKCKLKSVQLEKEGAPFLPNPGANFRSKPLIARPLL